MASIESGDVPMDNPAISWTRGKLYQWDGSLWWMLNERAHKEKYMVALPDLLEGSPNGYFNNLFCMLLIAQEVFATQISALNITLSEQIDAFGRPKQGVIQSSNFKEGVSGFRIQWDGNVEFNNTVARGRIEALSGFFKGLLNIGTAWDNEGNVYNPAARGSFIALNKELEGDNYEIRIKNLALYGKSVLGRTHGETPGQTIFDGFKLHLSSCATQLQAKNIEGNHGILSLYNHINAMLVNARNTSGYQCPINGTLRYSLPPPVNMGSWMHVNHIEISGITSRTYRIVGTSSEGYRLDITITSSSVRVDYLGNTSTGTTGTFEANFVFL